MTIDWLALVLTVGGILVAIAIFVFAWDFVRGARRGNRWFRWAQGSRRERRWQESKPSHGRNSQ